MARQHEAPAIEFKVAMPCPPITCNRHILAFRMVRQKIELHVQIIFVIDVRMVGQRNDRYLDEIAENQPPVVDDVRIVLFETGRPFDDGVIQIGLRLLQRGQRAAIDFRNEPSATMARIDAGGQKIIVNAWNGRLSGNPCVRHMVVFRDESLHALRKRQNGGVVTEELFVTANSLILRRVHPLALIQPLDKIVS